MDSDIGICPAGRDSRWVPISELSCWPGLPIFTVPIQFMDSSFFLAGLGIRIESGGEIQLFFFKKKIKIFFKRNIKQT